MENPEIKIPHIVQIMLGSNNMPLSKHIYSSVLGFAGAGDRFVCAENNGLAMGFGTRGAAGVLYMVGRQELMQIQFWNHTSPKQRPLPVEWRPNDIGFCRLGVAVPDFDATLERLSAENIRTITPPVEVDGLRRVCFLDPTVGIPVEIMEEGAALPGERDRYHDLEPAVVYATVSVTDLNEAAGYFRDVVGLEEVVVDLHAPEHEALWGLPNARRKTLVLRGGSCFLEIVQYEVPAGRPRSLDDGLDRDGFKTVGVGYRDPKDTEALFHRVTAAGLRWTIPNPPSFIGGNHVIDAVSHFMKLFTVTLENERLFGFSPEPEKWYKPPEKK